ncbi:bacteriohemerythrin [Cognaticolwellia mytili]|uniref:bacteriohemerythrin n=1 Tax=Cognaticolwellia mytili TaxID=1888913 RepID=UPI000A170C6B|nr:bacteriohemerythrin [Cognaticolwellia mytili]
MKISSQPDVVMIYQERDNVEAAIQQIMELELKFNAYKYNPEKLRTIAETKPKILLLSSNNIKNTIQLYINYLEKYEQQIAPHNAILLINSRETYRAYLACENGLFDNYVIINPLNEPYRLKLVLLQELHLIESHKNEGLEKLISEGEDELASCIEHGVILKKSFIQEVNDSKADILAASNAAALDSDEARLVLQNLVGLSLEGMNENISAGIQNILDQLVTLKLNSKALTEGVEKRSTPKKKTVVGMNTKLLTSDEIKLNPTATVSYKVLIAEPSNLFTRVIAEIFSETAFKYLLVNDGQTALTQISDFKPDVVLLAYDLPKINGFDITKTIRAQGNKVPIIAYVHQKDKAEVKRWIPLGLSGYLVKPSKKSAILKNIEKAVKNPIEIIPHRSNANNTDIQWVEEYSVGNADIDEQHKELFFMINDFFKQDSKAKAIMLFQNLSAYIDLHFATEEDLLRQINYPNTEEHIKKHDELRAKFHLLQDKLDNYHTDIHHKIGMFLYNWLAQHILKSDMEYRTYALSIEEPSFCQ